MLAVSMNHTDKWAIGAGRSGSSSPAITQKCRHPDDGCVGQEAAQRGTDHMV